MARWRGDTPAFPRHYRRNFWGFAMDFACFSTGMAFVSADTVIPSFLNVLGASATIIGLLSTLQRAGWMLPQLVAARYLVNKPRMKPYILLPAAVGRLTLLFLAGVIWATGARPAAIIIALTMTVAVLFGIGDGLASVPWFDLLSKSIPPERRGRVTGTGQALGGVMSFLAGIAVEEILGANGPPFPDNYALLFALGFAFFGLSYFAIAMLAEERNGPSTSRTVPPWRVYVRQLWAVFRQDRAFRLYILSRQLFSLGTLAMPFYMTYALDRLHLPEHVAGRYTSISVVGGVAAAIFFGWLNEHHGTRRAMLVSIVITAATPLLAILIPRVVTAESWLAWAYGLVFLANRVAMTSYMPAWTAYVLELAPATQRPLYVGLTNTLGGFAALFSTVGGLILAWTGGNYALLFLITTLGTLLTWPVVAALPEPRHVPSGEPV